MLITVYNYKCVRPVIWPFLKPICLRLYSFLIGFAPRTPSWRKITLASTQAMGTSGMSMMIGWHQIHICLLNLYSKAKLVVQRGPRPLEQVFWAGYRGASGGEGMLRSTPAHPGAPPGPWCRHINKVMCRINKPSVRATLPADSFCQVIWFTLLFIFLEYLLSAA